MTEERGLMKGLSGEDGGGGKSIFTGAKTSIRRFKEGGGLSSVGEKLK